MRTTFNILGKDERSFEVEINMAELPQMGEFIWLYDVDAVPCNHDNAVECTCNGSPIGGFVISVIKHGWLWRGTSSKIRHLDQRHVEITLSIRR